MDCQYASHFRYRFPNTSLETLITPPHLLLPKSCHILLVICQNMRHLIVLRSRKSALPVEVCLSPTFHCPKNATFYLSFATVCDSHRKADLPLPFFYCPKTLYCPKSLYCPKAATFYLSFARYATPPGRVGCGKTNTSGETKS